MGTSVHPLLFLDVDGPLIPFGGPGRYADGPAAPQRWEPSPAADSNPLLARIDPAHGTGLAALPCDLVWATTWMDDANACIAPLLGLPELPVVDWTEPSEQEERDVRAGLHWKTRPLLDRAGGRAFAWVDDEITDRDRAWVAARHGERALLHRVDPRTGLTGADFALLDGWLRGVRTGGPAP